MSLCQKATCGDTIVNLQVAPEFLRTLGTLPANPNMQSTLDPCELCMLIKGQLRLILQQLPPLHSRTCTCPMRQILLRSLLPKTTFSKSLALNQKTNLHICVIASSTTYMIMYNTKVIGFYVDPQIQRPLILLYWNSWLSTALSIGVIANGIILRSQTYQKGFFILGMLDARTRGRYISSYS